MIEGGTSFRESNERKYCALYQELVTGMSCQGRQCAVDTE